MTKPLNVKAHEHFFAFDPEEHGVLYETEGRYDACLTEEGRALVWSAGTDKHWEQPDYHTAKVVAKQMAEKFKERFPPE